MLNQKINLITFHKSVLRSIKDKNYFSKYFKNIENASLNFFDIALKIRN